MLAQALETENFEDIVDPRLEKNFVASEMFRMIEAAAACVRHSGPKRPRMSQVISLICRDAVYYSFCCNPKFFALSVCLPVPGG